MRILLGAMPVAAIVLLTGAMTAPTRAADQCEDGATVTLTGEVLLGFANKGGTSTFHVRSTSPCDVDLVTVDVANPPRACVSGATFTASGSIDEFIEVTLNAKSIACK